MGGLEPVAARPVLPGWQTSLARDFINNLAGSRRAFAHAQLYPGVGSLEDPAFGDYIQWQIEYCKPDSWKGYNIAPAASAFPGAEFAQWRLDDEVIAYPTYAVINANRRQLREHPGFFNICVHKGLSASGTQPGGANNTPDYGNPDDIVKVATDWPQFNWVIYHSWLPPELLVAAGAARYHQCVRVDAADDADRQRWPHGPQHPLVHAVRPDRGR